MQISRTYSNQNRIKTLRYQQPNSKWNAYPICSGGICSKSIIIKDFWHSVTSICLPKHWLTEPLPFLPSHYAHGFMPETTEMLAFFRFGTCPLLSCIFYKPIQHRNTYWTKHTYIDTQLATHVTHTHAHTHLHNKTGKWHAKFWIHNRKSEFLHTNRCRRLTAKSCKCKILAFNCCAM